MNNRDRLHPSNVVSSSCASHALRSIQRHPVQYSISMLGRPGSAGSGGWSRIAPLVESGHNPTFYFGSHTQAQYLSHRPAEDSPLSEVLITVAAPPSRRSYTLRGRHCTAVATPHGMVLSPSPRGANAIAGWIYRMAAKSTPTSRPLAAGTLVLPAGTIDDFHAILRFHLEYNTQS